MKTYMITFLVFIGVDMIWLVLVARKFYQNQIGFILRSPPNWYAALIFYAIFIFGLVHFVINPGLEAESMKKVIVNGLLFGLITYSTYDLTNMATLKDWPLTVTVVDMIWGTSLGGLVSTISYLILR